MSEPRHPTGGVYDCYHGAESAGKEPERSWDDFFRFKPRLLYIYLAETIERQGSPKNKREYCADALRKTCRRAVGFIWRCRRLVRHRRSIKAIIFVLTIAAIAATTHFVVSKPDAVVAFFTVVLAFIAAVQWQTTNRQLDQARVAASQTDRVIEQMLMEQRAWLSVYVPLVEKWTDTEFKCSVKIKNTGRTPAILEHENTVFYTAKLGTEDMAAQEKALDAAIAGKRPKEIVIAPDSEFILNWDERTVDTRTFPVVRNGDADLFILCRVIYRDAFDRQRISQKGSVWKSSARIFWGYPGYDKMT